MAAVGTAPSVGGWSMKSPSFLEESCLGKPFSPSRGEQPCHFSPAQDIFHNYEEELSHNGSTQLQLIASLLLALAAGPGGAARRVPPSIGETKGGRGISWGAIPTLPALAMCGGCQPLRGVSQSWGESTQLSWGRWEGNIRSFTPTPQQ